MQDKDVEIYSTHSERFVRPLKNKISKCLIWISKNVYINKLNDVAHRCNNAYHWTIKIKLLDVNLSTCFDFELESNDKGPSL